ncbi:uncharacterized protein LOC116146338 [Pistacia vera]|uniref:Uncharacterized protein n=1 Tax=Pistacia atlantica TaxID=434234 RepID=A0ACC1BYN3_9ROSI|nr:uncharacterized protein LOC116146338 [Pistacia vera]KAJ0104963.1 hypothetical protein Patl1_19067 [Pistacia atlantica]
MAVSSPYWASVRIITGTISGGILGFYVMHRVEISYKEKMKERLRLYEIEMKKRQEKLNELEDSA